MVIRHYSERHAIAIEIPPNCMSVLDSFYFKKYQKLAKDTLWIPGSRISKDLRHFRPCYKTWINKKKNLHMGTQIQWQEILCLHSPETSFKCKIT